MSQALGLRGSLPRRSILRLSRRNSFASPAAYCIAQLKDSMNDSRSKPGNVSNMRKETEFWTKIMQRDIKCSITGGSASGINVS